MISLKTLSVVLVASILISSPLATSFAQKIAHQSTPRTCSSGLPSNDATMTTSKLRSVKRVLPAPSPHWVGNGFHVFPVFADLAFTKELSPLLMFDYAAPRVFPPSTKAPLGVGQHPHRGFETVTIAFQGEVEHKDSTGKSGVIHPGDVQWMTAGRGIVHQEFHSNAFTKNGGTFGKSIANVLMSLIFPHAISNGCVLLNRQKWRSSGSTCPKRIKWPNQAIKQSRIRKFQSSSCH